MNSPKKDQEKPYFRDGTSQHDRMLKALAPSFVSIEERSPLDILEFVGKVGRHLKYHHEDEERGPSSWEPFFSYDADEIAAVLEIAEQQENMESAVEPHLALLFAFIKLLKYPQQQFRSLTARHLDFYYQQVLGLTEKPPTPDQVHVLFELAKNVEEHPLPKGTLLRAGKDSIGKDLYYATAHKSLINRATVSDLRSIHVKKERIGLKEIHERGNMRDDAFIAMLCLALGSPGSGDPLPIYSEAPGNEIDFTDLKEMYAKTRTLADEGDISAEDNYILDGLNFVTIEDFNTCVALQIRETESRNSESIGIDKPTGTEWYHVYELVEKKAFRKKINRQQRDALEEKYLRAKAANQDPFLAVLDWALGEPSPGDPCPKPPNEAPLDENLISSDEGRKFVREHLCLGDSEYLSLITSKVAGKSDEICRLLVRACNKKNQFSYPEVCAEEISDISVMTVLDRDIGRPDGAETFRPFGEAVGPGLESLSGRVGFAVSSPQLLLEQGKRTITLTLACEDGTLAREKIAALLADEGPLPFAVELSGEKEWLTPDHLDMAVGDFLMGAPIREGVTSEKPDKAGKIKVSTAFDAEKDRGRFLVYDDGTIYRVVSISTQGFSIGLEQLGQVDFAAISFESAALFEAADVFFNAIKFVLMVDRKQAAITPPLINDGRGPTGDWPLISVSLSLMEMADKKRVIFPYDLFKSIYCEKVYLRVAAEDIPVSCIRNDGTVLKAKGPCGEPFGNQPMIGSGFYFIANELCRKKIDALDLRIEWMGLPISFSTHYSTYVESKVLAIDDINHASFKARLSLYDNGLWREQDGFSEEQNLFAVTDDNSEKLQPSVTLQFDNLSVKQPDEEFIWDDSTTDPFEWPRYFKLEVAGLDFQHGMYPQVVNWAAVQAAASIATTPDAPISKTVYPPYTPQMKSLAIGYSASEKVSVSTVHSEKMQQEGIRLYHLHPFGYAEIQGGADSDGDGRQSSFLLPQFTDEGFLHIGLSNLQPLQDISLLYQVVAGSGEVGEEMPKLSWQYLAGDGWKSLSSTDILEDTTSDLLDSGIVRLHIPTDATDQSTLLPDGRFWLRITGHDHCLTLADIVDIKAQAVRAVFVDHGNAQDHLDRPLAAESITALKERDAAIKGVCQPYGSFGGKRQETGDIYYRRLSERLRHKDRALTAWDYERLILDQFPEIYKTKCLSRSVLDGYEETLPGEVSMVVVPDISHTAPFFPLAPRAPLYLLRKIEAYLGQRTPPAVTVRARNPRYEQIQYRIGAQFREGFRSGYYLKKLNEDVKRYLSPWAYEENADIPLGSSIHNANLINYLEGLEYVDYIVHLKLLDHRLLGREGKDTVYEATEAGSVRVHHPASILVSAPNHIIDFIAEKSYEEEEFEGIGYMIIGKDFVISGDPDLRHERIGEMIIETDFLIS